MLEREISEGVLEILATSVRPSPMAPSGKHPCSSYQTRSGATMTIPALSFQGERFSGWGAIASVLIAVPTETAKGIVPLVQLP